MRPETLMTLARAVAKSAYCPYSGFHVGAAILWEDDSVTVGCNVENASYGLTICAERSAVFVGLARLKRSPVIKCVAVSCPDLPDEGFDPRLAMPCGACRQVLDEFASSDAEVAVDRVGSFKLTELLPDAFRL